MLDMETTTATTLMRPATAADRAALTELAALDSAAPLAGRVLLAEADDRLVAALSLDDGRVVADPFARTRAVVAMLRVAAHGSRGRARSRATLRLARAVG